MIEFITEYWHFFVAGLILLALITYWVVDVMLSKKDKERKLNEMEAKLLEEQAEEELEEKPTKAKEPAKAKDQEEELGIYTVSYDAEKKDWVVKKRGNQRATKRTKTKKEAVDYVKTLTQNQDIDVVIKTKDGK